MSMLRRKVPKLASLAKLVVIISSLVLFGCGSSAPTASPSSSASAKSPAASQSSASPSGSASSAAKPSGNPVKVGFMTPLTGRMQNNGLAQQLAVKLAVEDINASGGINGHPLEVVTFDSPFDPQQAVTGIRKLIEQDKVMAVLGPFASAEVEAAGPIAKQLQTPLMTASASKPGIVQPNQPWVFRYAELDEFGIPVAVQGFKKIYPNVKKVVITGDTKESVSENIVKNLFPKALKDQGMEVIDTVGYDTGTTDFSAIVTKMKSLNPDAVAVSDVLGVGIAKEMERQGLKVPVVTGYQVQPTPFLATVGSAGEGWVAVRYSTIENPDPAFQKFLTRFNDGIKAGNLKIDQMSLEAGAYDALMIMTDIMRKGNITSDTNLQQARTAIRDGLAKVKDWKGPYGTVSMSDQGEMHWTTYPHLAKNGKWELIK